MCMEHAGGMFIVQFSNWMIPLCFARRKLVFLCTDFPAKHVSESLHLRHLKHLISLRSQVFFAYYHRNSRPKVSRFRAGFLFAAVFTAYRVKCSQFTLEA